jgi:hypothetical protein
VAHEEQMQEKEELLNPSDEASKDNGKDVAEQQSEFKITVRKLEMPVRPRGVLAE